MVVFFFKQKTAYEMRISDWSSDVCSSDLRAGRGGRACPGASTASPPTARPASRRARSGRTRSAACASSARAARRRRGRASRSTDRKSVGEGKSVAVRVSLGGRRNIQNKKNKHHMTRDTTETQTKKYPNK